MGSVKNTTNRSIKTIFNPAIMGFFLLFNTANAQNSVKTALPDVNSNDLSRWIGNELLPEKGQLTLKDIVIPGSHDAGMSVLTATGGSQKGTINKCNTLTQSLSIEKQMKAGIRMFDLRPGVLKDTLYLKHSSSDCMEDAIGGGYGEKLLPVLAASKNFLQQNPSEFLIFSFSHFCPKEIAVETLAKKVIAALGKEHVFVAGNKKLEDITINELSGKVLLAFESPKFSDPGIVINSMTERSDLMLNFKRAYAATNNLNKLILTETVFFNGLKTQLNPNDLVRLDWQLTQSAKEAAMVCNAFESDQPNPLFDGALLLTNVLSRHKSIISHARSANKVLKKQITKWVEDGTINQQNKPNILYVDDAGEWITQYCIELNKSSVYINNKRLTGNTVPLKKEP